MAMCLVSAVGFKGNQTCYAFLLFGVEAGVIFNKFTFIHFFSFSMFVCVANLPRIIRIIRDDAGSAGGAVQYQAPLQNRSFLDSWQESSRIA